LFQCLGFLNLYQITMNLKIKLVNEHDEDIYLVVNIGQNMFFSDLDEILKKAIAKEVHPDVFFQDTLSSFYICDKAWNEQMEITLLDMGDEEMGFNPTMSEVALGEYLKSEGDVFKYIIDYSSQIYFLGEVLEISAKDAKTQSPVITFGDVVGLYKNNRFGQLTADDYFLLADEDEMDSIGNKRSSEFDDDDLELEEDFDEEDHDEFGFGDFDDFGGGRKGPHNDDY